MPDPTHINREFLVDTGDWPAIRHALQTAGGGLEGLEVRLELFLNAAFRDKVPALDQAAAQLHQSLFHAHSPHAWLDPRPIDLERGCALRSFSGPQTYGHGVPDYPSSPLPRGTPSRVELVEPWPDAHLAAFTSITDGSNGRVEAAAFRVIDGPREPSRALIESLADVFAPLKDGPRAAPFAAARIEPKQALQRILQVAMLGGAYTAGLGAARGRLHTWQTMSYLVGSSPTALFTAIADAARKSAWISIDSDSKWFDKLIWDGCLVCLPHDSELVTALTWTDSD